MIHISKRLQAVADMVCGPCRLLDVGTDHGYVPIYLVQAGIASRALAMDVNRGPLQKAEENIAAWHLEDRIATRLSDGLAAFEHGEADSLVIAGMGGLLMRDILAAGRSEGKLSGFKEMILQPQSDMDVVRRTLHGWGYYIDREDMVIDAGKYYTVLHVVAGQQKFDHPLEYLYGRYLPEHGHPVMHQYLLRQLQNKKERLMSLSAADTPGAAAYRPRLLEEIESLTALLQKYYPEQSGGTDEGK